MKKHQQPYKLYIILKILPMKILYIFLCILVTTACGLNTGKQSSKLEQLEARYCEGDRDTTLLRELLSELYLDSLSLAKLSKASVADAYLCTFPISERYQGSHANLFIKEVDDFQLQSYQDMIHHWKQLDTLANSHLFLKKIESDAFNYAKQFFNHYRDELQIPDAFSFQEIIFAYATIQSPGFKKRLHIFQLIQLAIERNIDSMIKIIEKNFIAIDYYPTSFSDLFLYNGCLRIVLDLCDKQQCIRMFELLSKAGEENTRNRYKKMIFSFSGKLKYIDYYNTNEDINLSL